MSEKEWITKVKSVLKNLFSIEYEKVDCSSLWGIRLVILVKPEHSQKISHVQHQQVIHTIYMYMYTQVKSKYVGLTMVLR